VGILTADVLPFAVKFLKWRKSRVEDAFFTKKMAYLIYGSGSLILFCGISENGDLILSVGGVKLR